MELHLQLLSTLIIIYGTRASIVPGKFRKVEPCETITAKIAAELTTRSKIQCSYRCLRTQKCESYKYNVLGQGNCLLIQRNSTAEEGQIFEPERNSIIYQKDSEGIWTPPSGWTGPDAVLYKSLDNTIGLILMERAKQKAYYPLICGQVNCALNLDRTRKQWVDLGIHTEVCMTRPDTCGAAGGAISMWVNLVDCPGNSGILSTRESGKTSSAIYCTSSGMRVQVNLHHGLFIAYPPRPIGWSQITVNFIGPNDGDGIRIFYDGAEVASDTSNTTKSLPASNGKIVVGKRLIDRDYAYSSVQVDELIFFNRVLTNDEVETIYNSI